MNNSRLVPLALPVLGLLLAPAVASAQTELIFITVPDSSVGVHLEFTNTAGSGDFTQFSMFGVATHGDTPPPPDPPALHTLVIVFEWRIAPGIPHDDTTWAQSPDMITTVIGGMTNPFSTGVFVTPGAWETVAVHMYAGFPITVSAEFDHRWIPAPGTAALLGLGGLMAARRRR